MTQERQGKSQQNTPHLFLIFTPNNNIQPNLTSTKDSSRKEENQKSIDVLIHFLLSLSHGKTSTIT
jgi:hypothetical protein